MVEILSYILFIAIYSINVLCTSYLRSKAYLSMQVFFPAAGPIFSNIIKKYLIFPEVYIKKILQSK